MPKGIYTRKKGIKRPNRQRRKLLICEYCQVTVSIPQSKPSRFCSRPCYASFTIGKNHPRHKDDKITTQGYRLDNDALASRRITEHRAIAAKVLGRSLKRSEVVHHINGDKLDNAHDNLLICTVSYHQQLHMRMADLYMKEHLSRATIAKGAA